MPACISPSRPDRADRRWLTPRRARTGCRVTGSLPVSSLVLPATSNQAAPVTLTFHPSHTPQAHSHIVTAPNQSRPRYAQSWRKCTKFKENTIFTSLYYHLSSHQVNLGSKQRSSSQKRSNSKGVFPSHQGSARLFLSKTRIQKRNRNKSELETK